VFDAKECALESLPASITQCRRLQKLWASENKLTELPEAMVLLRRLTDLFVQVLPVVYFVAESPCRITASACCRAACRKFRFG
jgi:hypothetical protein